MPKISEFGSSNHLKCPNCGEYRYLVIKGVRFEAPVARILGLKIPFFECELCGESEPIQSREDILNITNQILENEMNDHEIRELSSRFENKKFEAFDDLDFTYDSLDYYAIPGLSRPWDDGYLTPVFFNKDLLLYYNNHDDYKVVLYSFSTVDIFTQDGEELIPHGFGINRNGILFAWLGDLHKALSQEKHKAHLYRFRASNVESDHDVVSDFYFQQIEAEFTESDNEYQIFALKQEFEEKIFRLFKFRLSELNFDDLSIEYKHPILNEKNQIFNAYVQLNKVLIESIQTKRLKDALIKTGVAADDIKNLGGLKLLEAFLKQVLAIEDASELVCPLFVLYDLRILGSHLKNSTFNENYNSCKKRLNCDSTIKHIDFFNVTISSTRNMYQKLNQRLDKILMVR